MENTKRLIYCLANALKRKVIECEKCGEIFIAPENGESNVCIDCVNKVTTFTCQLCKQEFVVEQGNARKKKWCYRCRTKAARIRVRRYRQKKKEEQHKG